MGKPEGNRPLGRPSCRWAVYIKMDLGDTGLICLGIGDQWKFLVKKNLHGPSPQSNYTDRGTAACRRSDCQLLMIEGASGQRDGSLRPYSRFSRQVPLLFYQVAPQLYSRG
jgi:hypothetical protein